MAEKDFEYRDASAEVDLRRTSVTGADRGGLRKRMQAARAKRPPVSLRQAERMHEQAEYAAAALEAEADRFVARAEAAQEAPLEAGVASLDRGRPLAAAAQKAVEAAREARQKADAAAIEVEAARRRKAAEEADAERLRAAKRDAALVAAEAQDLRAAARAAADVYGFAALQIDRGAEGVTASQVRAAKRDAARAASRAERAERLAERAAARLDRPVMRMIRNSMNLPSRLTPS